MYYSKCLLFWVMWLFEQIFKTYIPTDPYFNSMATWNRHILGLIWNPVKWRCVASGIELVSSGNQAVIMDRNTPILTYIFKYTTVNKYMLKQADIDGLAIQLSLLSPVGTCQRFGNIITATSMTWIHPERMALLYNRSFYRCMRKLNSKL